MAMVKVKISVEDAEKKDVDEPVEEIEQKKPADAEESKESNESTDYEDIKDEDDEEDDNKDEAEKASSVESSKPKKPRNRLAAAYWRHRKITIPVAIVILIVIILAIPVTRYAIVGLFYSEQIKITVIDSTEGNPVSQAVVKIDGKTVHTDGSGVVTVNSHIGYRTISVTKQYFKDSTTSVEVPVIWGSTSFKVSLVATGRLSAVTVLNAISGEPVAEAKIDAGNNNTVTTDTDGTATIVIPASEKAASVKVSADNYLEATQYIDPTTTNQLSITPSGSMYFLSNLSGKIDVVKTNLDGSDRQTVLAGTGLEDAYSTSLLASRDWKYLGLKANRQAVSNNADSLYVINTENDSLLPIDVGNNFVTPIGWSGHYFLYAAKSTTLDNLQAGSTTVKSYNAETQKTVTIDQNAAGYEPYGDYESIENYYIQGDQLVYTKEWYSQFVDSGDHDDAIVTANVSGSAKTTLKTVTVQRGGSWNATLGSPDEVYFSHYDVLNKTSLWFELENGEIKTLDGGSDIFNKSYPTYLLSPSGSSTLWDELRDGKNTIFVGDADAANGQQIATLSDYTAYGWFTDDYILLQKNGSELYITTPDQLKAGVDPIKVSDYYKTGANYAGYGAGYGGQ